MIIPIKIWWRFCSSPSHSQNPNTKTWMNIGYEHIFAKYSAWSSISESKNMARVCITSYVTRWINMKIQNAKNFLHHSRVTVHCMVDHLFHFFSLPFSFLFYGVIFPLAFFPMWQIIPCPGPAFGFCLQNPFPFVVILLRNPYLLWPNFFIWNPF